MAELPIRFGNIDVVSIKNSNLPFSKNQIETLSKPAAALIFTKIKNERPISKNILIKTVKFKDFIYITFCHDNNAESNYEEMDSSCLGNILYTIYRLKKIGFKIIIGYTFINSILFSVLDCDFVASGWFNTLRKFQKNRFDLSDTFGRRKKGILVLHY